MSATQSEESKQKARDRVRRFRERKRIGNAITRTGISPSAVRLALEQPVQRGRFPIQEPVIPKGIVPDGVKPAVSMAMDESAYQCARMAHDAGPEFGAQLYAYSNIEGFPGYPYLMLLALRSEYRNMATALATELTRKWINFNSTDTDDEGTKEKISEIEQAFTKLGIQQIIRKAAEHDACYGTGQILINIDGATLKDPLIISPKTIKKGSLQGFKNVDPIWTTPLMYNSLTPAKPDFYRPSSWWVMGEHWDATRLIIVITREVPDIFKPGFNFSGMSLSQLAEPYVNNWLRTRQSVSDLINNFSIVVLKTAMDQVLTGGDDGSNLFDRIKLFTACRSNKGVMALDKDREELEQIAVPLGGLHELQAQALEQLCVVSREPATVLTGITPSGFGNVAEGEVRIWYDYIAAQQEAYYRAPIQKMLDLVQMSLYGEIDPDITFDFNPLYEMTEEQESIIRVNDSIRAGNLIDRSVIDATEERERLARDPDSGYVGIDIEREIAPPDEEELKAGLARGTA
jgi:phage-related protein (TIGR01555 family)